VENVIARTSDETTEVVIWNNASTDGTRAYLDGLIDPRITVVDHDRNIGLQAYARAFALTTADHLVELDDDIIDAPKHWDKTLLEAYERLPQVGYLAANLVNNPHDVTARIMYRTSAHLYRIEEVNGVRLKLGPVGGGCTMTSRELYHRVGGFRPKRRSIFWQEDAAYISALAKLGYGAAYLEELRVLHAGGEYYSKPAPAKTAFWNAYHRAATRRRKLKHFLVRVPLVRRLNERFRLFEAPGKRS
jgi:GT2 family glycosyltransferase